MKNKFFFIALGFFVTFQINAQPLEVNSNGHFLKTPAGKDFFWLADTGWELFHRLNRSETTEYLQTRSNQGYNVIQAVALYELEAMKSPNDYGDFPFKGKYVLKFDTTAGNNPDNPQEYDYWDHVEFVLSEAVRLKIHIALLPCWGEFVTPREREQLISTEKMAYEFGWFFGNRFKKYNNNIVWMLGGDRLPDETSNGLSIWRAMAEGITDGVNSINKQDGKANYKHTFMTFHCYRSSSEWFHHDAWLDMHTWGSYHEKRDNERTYMIAPLDWNLSDPKPTFNSEPAYESSPINYDSDKAQWGFFDDFDVRQVAYWSVFSGACGHTYGNHVVWQMFKKKNNSSPLTNQNKKEWYEALTEPGSLQMTYLKDLMLSRPYESRIPNQNILASKPHDHTGRMISTSGKGYCMVYLPTGRSVEIDFKALKFDKIKAWWFNPRNCSSEIIQIFDNDGKIHSFDPQGTPERTNDWVLVLDDDQIQFEAPGIVSRK